MLKSFFGVVFSAIIIASSLQSLVFAQSNKLLFDHLSPIKGLGQRSITSIVQDNYGFIWFGTQDGLMRFDGYELKFFKNNLHNDNSLSDNNIRALTKDKEGNLWIATQGGGLNKFDIVHESFIHFVNEAKNDNSLSGNAVWSVLVDQQGVIWSGTWSNGLNAYEVAPKKWKHYGEGSSQDPVLAIAESSKGLIWYGMSGLNSIDRLGKVKKYSASTFEIGGIRSILEDSSGKLWLATDLAGVVLFDPNNGEFKKFDTENHNPSFHCLTKTNDGRIWMGGDSGIIVYNPTNNQLIVSSHNDLDPYSLSNNSVRVILEDNQGTIWLGNEGGGINQLLTQKAFKTFRHDNNVEGSLTHNLIRSLYDDSNGAIWVGTQGGGLNKLDASTNKFIKVDKVGKNTINSEEISSILQDRQGIYWIGTWGSGINKIDFNKKTIELYKHDPSNTKGPLDNRIQKVYEDKFGMFWVGTENGLSQFNASDNTWKSFANKPNDPNSLISNTIQGQAFLEQEDGTLWIGTWSGLNKISPDRKTITHYTTENKLSSNHVISACLDRSGNLWLGTFGGGLNKLELATNEVTQFTDQDGLPNNTIFGVKEDNDGGIWLSTNNGLSKFNPKTKQFRNYDISEGLQSNEFYWGAAHKNKDGSMMFGGVNGLNIFNPEDIKDNSTIPPIVFSDFQVFNKSVNIDTTSVLKQDINSTQVITLQHDQAVLTFQFSYMLENFDKNWIQSDKRTATYTNLDPGNYIFKVKGSNNDNVWNESGKEITIIITPPFWRTWWFYLIVLVLIGTSIYGFIKYREKSLKAEKEAMEESFSKSLLEARESLKAQQIAFQEEQEHNKDRIWLDQSLAKFSEILSVSRKDVSSLSSKILIELIKYLHLVGGAVYLVNEKEDVLFMSVSFGFSKVKRTIEIGEGLIGTCYEKSEQIQVDSVPTNYSQIESGLGKLHPSFLLIIPIKTEENKLGVLELASFEKIKTIEQQFVHLLVERMSTTIEITTLIQRTSQLLEQSKLNTEDLKLREEELKQNLEELQAIQEDRDRKSKKLEAEIIQLKDREIELMKELGSLGEAVK